MTRSPWLVSARFDTLAFVLPALCALVLAALGSRFADTSGATPTWAWLLFVVAIDVAHVHGTTLRVYFDAGERQRRPALYLGVPVLALVGGVLAHSVSAQLFWRCLAYLAVYHFVRQQLGWLRLYRRRACELGAFDRVLDEGAIYCATLYPLIAWHTALPSPFVWFVAGDFVPGLPPWLANVARDVWALWLSVFGLWQAWRLALGESWRFGKTLLVATTAATWWAGIVLWASDFAFTVTNVVAHGVPYMAISWHVGKQRVRGSSDLLTTVHRTLPRYVLGLFALACVEEWLWDGLVWREHGAFLPDASQVATRIEALVVPLLALPQLTHYVLDAYLWRLDGSNPGLAEQLGVASRPPDAT